MTGQHLFADYHFHPNFNFGRCLKTQASQIWDAFKKHKLDVVVVCEHAWKRPTDSFHVLQDHRPADCDTFLLPGIEVLTKEGLDVVVFGPCGSWYSETNLSDLFEPYHPRIDDVIRLVQQPHHPVRGFLPHPYTRGTTGTVEFYGLDEAKQLATALGGVEASNNCYEDALHLSRRLGRWFPKTMERMLRTEDIGDEFLDEVKVDFIAIGSDAHFPAEIGYGCMIEVSDRPQSADDAYRAMTTNRTREGVPRKFKPAIDRVFHVSKSAYITAHEAIQKKAIRNQKKRAKKLDNLVQPKPATI